MEILRNIVKFTIHVRSGHTFLPNSITPRNYSSNIVTIFIDVVNSVKFELIGKI